MNHPAAPIASSSLAVANSDNGPLTISLTRRLCIYAFLWLATTLLFTVVPDSPFIDTHTLTDIVTSVLATPVYMAMNLASLAGWDPEEHDSLSHDHDSPLLLLGGIVYVLALAGFTMTRKRFVPFVILCAVHVIQAAVVAARFQPDTGC